MSHHKHRTCITVNEFDGLTEEIENPIFFHHMVKAELKSQLQFMKYDNENA